MDVLRVGGVQPQRHPLARLRDRVQVDARDNVADSERDRLGVEHDGVRRSCVGALQPQVLLVESGGTLQIAHLQGNEVGSGNGHDPYLLMYVSLLTPTMYVRLLT